MLHDDHIHLRAHEPQPPPYDAAVRMQAAAAAGVVPNFLDHAPLPTPFQTTPFIDYNISMKDSDVDDFLGEGREHGCALGLEGDYMRGMEQEIADKLKQVLDRAAELDVEISCLHGGVHYLPSPGLGVTYIKSVAPHLPWDMEQMVFEAYLKEKGPEGVLREYFKAVRGLVDTGFYDVLAHLEIIRKFDHQDDSGRSVYFGDVEGLYRQLSRDAVEHISSTEMALEINTAGIFTSFGRQFMSQELLDYAVELEVPICLGSDAHVPERIGAGFDLVIPMLERAGCTRLVTFQNRRPVSYSWKDNSENE